MVLVTVLANELNERVHVLVIILVTVTVFAIILVIVIVKELATGIVQ